MTSILDIPDDGADIVDIPTWERFLLIPRQYRRMRELRWPKDTGPLQWTRREAIKLVWMAFMAGLPFRVVLKPRGDIL